MRYGTAAVLGDGHGVLPVIMITKKCGGKLLAGANQPAMLYAKNARKRLRLIKIWFNDRASPLESDNMSDCGMRNFKLMIRADSDGTKNNKPRGPELP